MYGWIFAMGFCFVSIELRDRRFKGEFHWWTQNIFRIVRPDRRRISVSKIRRPWESYHLTVQELPIGNFLQCIWSFFWLPQTPSCSHLWIWGKLKKLCILLCKFSLKIQYWVPTDLKSPQWFSLSRYLVISPALNLLMGSKFSFFFAFCTWNTDLQNVTQERGRGSIPAFSRVFLTKGRKGANLIWIFLVRSIGSFVWICWTSYFWRIHTWEPSWSRK